MSKDSPEQKEEKEQNPDRDDLQRSNAVGRFEDLDEEHQAAIKSLNEELLTNGLLNLNLDSPPRSRPQSPAASNVNNQQNQSRNLPSQ
jgi:hypothetical protein